MECHSFQHDHKLFQLLVFLLYWQLLQIRQAKIIRKAHFSAILAKKLKKLLNNILITRKAWIPKIDSAIGGQGHGPLALDNALV